jgi:hypothetical protein
VQNPWLTVSKNWKKGVFLRLYKQSWSKLLQQSKFELGRPFVITAINYNIFNRKN